MMSLPFRDLGARGFEISLGEAPLDQVCLQFVWQPFQLEAPEAK